ncbi:(4Fe-4S)-binding protein [Parapedobacter deserti]|uniref:(4Fe-4S)-binding protein n=1 Tax=Parapedobacter deserti TaxID=1912957 RepID=A0ABV7JEM5_9SPHI
METHEYEKGETIIVWNPKLCIHSGICVRTLPAVYNPKARPWINTANATTEELIDQVGKCPSGALRIKNSSPENQ